MDEELKYRKSEWLNFDAMDQFLLMLAAKGFEPSLVFDVGAAKGGWAKTARSAFPKAEIHMFEPITTWRSELDAACASLGNARWTQAAVGATSGMIEIERNPIPTRSLVPLPGHKTLHPTEQVVVVTVDDVMQQSYPGRTLDLLKVDVQAYELQVLKGSVETLKACQVVLLECSLYPFVGENTPIFHDIYDHMRASGFVLFDIPSMMRRSGDHALGQIDACFVRPDSWLRQGRPHTKPFEWMSFRPRAHIPAYLAFGQGFILPQFDETREWRFCDQNGWLFIVNTRDRDLRVKFISQVILAGPDPGELRYSVAGGPEGSLTCVGNRNVLELILTVPAASHLELRLEGPANISLQNRMLSFRLVNYRLEVLPEASPPPA